jgi:opacity protein-like surface antigen
MGSLKALFLAGAVATAATAAAQAADLPPPPPVEPIPAPAPEFSGWYLRGDVGVGAAVLTKFSTNISAATINEKNLDDAAFVGFGAGYQFNNWLRLDITGEYRGSQRFQAIESAAFGPVTGVDTYNASFQSSVFIANGYVDLGTWYGATPYIGAGAGVALNRVASLTDVGSGAFAGGVGFAPNNTIASFAWAAMAGLAFDITPNVKLDLNYRYLNLGRAQSAGINCFNVACGGGVEVQKYRLASNDFRVGLRWMFGAPPAPVYEGPIVRKY